MAKKTNGHRQGALRLYRSYNFVTKNPVIDKLRTLKAKEGVTDAEIAVLSGVSTTTFHSWFEGDTRSPQHATIEAAARALGYESKFVKSKRVDFVKEVEKAKAELEAAKQKLQGR